MPGRFHELSIATADIRASLDFYESLGFWQAPTGDAWHHPYAVVTDGRVVLGLHAAVRDHSVGMVPRIAGGRLPEPQALIEIERSADVGGGNAELVKSSRHEGLRRHLSQAAVPRGLRAGLTSKPASTQP